MLPKFEYEYVSYDELYQAYEDCRKHKWKTANAAQFQVRLAYNLYQLWVDLNRWTYNIGRSISFLVDRPVIREVFAADFRDRIVHHLLINRLILFYEKRVITTSFSCRVGKGTQYGVKTLAEDMKRISENYTKDAWVLKCDLKSFFMTINKKMLYNKVDELIREDVYPNDERQYQFSSWIGGLIINNCPQEGSIRKSPIEKWNKLPKDKSLYNAPLGYGLPIGNLTSQIFANYYLDAFDKFIYNDLGFTAYGRYVDDFYIISTDKEKLLNAIPKMKALLKTMEVKLHPKKIYLQHISHGVKFIGAVVKPNRIYTGKRTLGNFKHFLRKANAIYCGKEMSKSEVAKFVSSCNSYFGFIKHYSTYNIRKKFIKQRYFDTFQDKIYFDQTLNKITPFREYSIYNKGFLHSDLIQNPSMYKIGYKYFPIVVI